MFRRRKPFNRKLWFIRVYVTLMTVILAASLLALLSQSAQAQTLIPAGDRAAVQTSDSITVHYHGTTTKTTAGGETAGELLQRLGLTVSGEDVVSHGLEEKTYDNMILQIDAVVTREETTAIVIPRQTLRCGDETLPEGTEQVLVEGSDGELLRTDRVTYTNGRETGRESLTQTVARQPVNRIVAVGTKTAEEATLRITDDSIHLPTGEVLTYTKTATVRATAYTQTDAGCDGITATGTNVRRGTVAVDPRYIPYGTRMFIRTVSGSYIYGIAVAEDCGGDIKGDRMDLYFPTYEEAREFGRRVCTVYFLG